MKLYQFTLPQFDNARRSYHNALGEWERQARQEAGGFTQSFAQGVWEDKGATYQEPVYLYTVALEREEQFTFLLTAAFSLFPDQLAIFTAEIGSATIHSRDPVPA